MSADDQPMIGPEELDELLGSGRQGVWYSGPTHRGPAQAPAREGVDAAPSSAFRAGPAPYLARLRSMPGVDLLPALLVCALIVTAVLLSGCKPDPPTCQASTVAQWRDDPRSQDPDVGYWACAVPTAHAGEYR